MRNFMPMLIVALLLAACAQSKNICGVTYQPYGLLNEDDRKNPDIQYEVVWGNVVWGTVLAETIVMPIYFGGFALFEPVGLKPKIKGQAPLLNDCASAQHAGE